MKYQANYTTNCKYSQFKIKIKTQMETKPIFFGKAPNDELQDYALTAFSYEEKDTEFVQKYEKNDTKLIIEKQDYETKEKLKGATFQILNQDNKIIKTVETNKNGQIILEQVVPGTYYIREIKAPNGYEADGELQKINIKMNEKQTIKVENRKIIIEEPKVEEPKKEVPKPKVEIPVEEVPKLPITGM